MIQCDDECPRDQTLLAAVVTAIGGLVAAAAPPLIRAWREGRSERLELERRMARVEGLAAALSDDAGKDDDGEAH